MSESASSLPSILEYSEDVSTAEAPPPLPPRVYPAQVISAMQRVSKTTGNTYVALQVRIPAEVYPVDHVGGNPEGTVLSYNRVLVQDTYDGRYRMRLLCEALGIAPGRNVDLNRMIGCACRVDVTNEPYDGIMRNQANAILHP